MFDTLKITTFAIFMAFTGTSQAAVIDLVSATNDGTTLTAADAIITAGPLTTLQVGDFVDNAVCPVGGDGCNGIMTLLFNFDVNNVSFEYGYGNPGDFASLTILNSVNAILGFLNLTSTSDVVTADLSSFGTIRSILFNNSASTGAGYAFGNITYNPASVVPLPGSLPLLLAGLGGLLFLRRRRAV